MADALAELGDALAEAAALATQHMDTEASTSTERACDKACEAIEAWRTYRANTAAEPADPSAAYDAELARLADLVADGFRQASERPQHGTVAHQVANHLMAAGARLPSSTAPEHAGTIVSIDCPEGVQVPPGTVMVLAGLDHLQEHELGAVMAALRNAAGHDRWAALFLPDKATPYLLAPDEDLRDQLVDVLRDLGQMPPEP